ncbi:16S rRNA pseudouridine(516) synthase [Aureimonas leprariae]|uniref:Pseudouridine synthase n=1 Tax=Plantimonas leprariae TaxID=2615207 RepID=A0A7V7PNU0_9HYPH|nr:16S rRNA pseudouridine(516) synthase [Aureimonas leprariae]KAB0679554.1 pseudouridine synthase [Aureimonas leprariae]
MKVPTLRLDRLLGNMGYGSRKEIALLARRGGIVLDGAPLPDADRRIAVSADLATRMTVAGEPLDPPPGLVILMHKPLGVTCSHKEAGPLVYGLLPARWRRREPAISTVGRLDKETSGLLLLTDDGGYLHRVISPKRHVPKRYVARLARPLRGDEGAVFAAGTLLLEGEEKPLMPAVLEPLADGQAALTVTEGRYHQVRRMFAAVGNHVEALHRDRLGGLALPADLAPGEFRVLGEGEAAQVFASPA